MVQLVVEIEDEDDVDFGDVDWEHLCGTQALPLQADFGDAEEGDVFAMEDRQCVAEEWPGRKVFVGMSEGCVWVFDEHGKLINEPAEGVALGFQPFSGLDMSFQDRLAEGYYRLVPRQQEQQQQEPAAGSFDTTVVEGARVQMAFGFPEAHWYGALVGRVLPCGKVELAFDDGQLLRYSMDDLRLSFDSKTLEPLDASKGGVVATESGQAAAACFVRLKDAGGHQKSMGVLVGKDESRLVFGLPVHMSFYVADGVFDATPAAPARRVPAQSLQDRLGFHTFRRGDLVEYVQCEVGEDSPVVAVYGILNHEPEGNAQSRKFLLLYEVQAKTFFLGSLPQWRRVRNRAGTFDTFDCDNDSHVQTLTYDLTVSMANTFKELSDVLLVGNISKAQRVAMEPPPSLKLARSEERRQEQDELKAAAKEQRRQDKLDATKAAAAAKAAAAKAAAAKAAAAKAAAAKAAAAKDSDTPELRSDPSQPRGSPVSSRRPEELETPPSIVQMKRELHGLRRAQGIEQTAARGQQIGELEYDLERREKKFRREGR